VEVIQKIRELEERFWVQNFAKTPVFYEAPPASYMVPPQRYGATSAEDGLSIRELEARYLAQNFSMTPEFFESPPLTTTEFSIPPKINSTNVGRNYLSMEDDLNQDEALILDEAWWDMEEYESFKVCIQKSIEALHAPYDSRKTIVPQLEEHALEKDRLPPDKENHEMPTFESTTSADGKFLDASNDNVEAFGCDTFHELREGLPILVEDKGVQGRGNEEVYSRTLIGSLHYSSIKDSHLTSINLEQVNWEKHMEDVGSMVKNLTLARDRSPHDIESEEWATLSEEKLPPPIIVGEHWEKKKIEEVEETYLIEFEHVASFDKDEWIYMKKTLQGINQSLAKRLKQSLHLPSKKLNNSCPGLFPWRPKCQLMKHLSLKRAQGIKHREVDCRRMKNMKTPHFSLLHVLEFDQVVLKEFTGKLAHFLFFGINLASYDRGEHSYFQVEILDEDANSKALKQKDSCMLNELIFGKKTKLGIQEFVGKKKETYYDPHVHVLILDNSQPKMFPWRPKTSWLKPQTCIPQRQVSLWFNGSSYATCSREEHTLFKPP